jgi:hypothetical protein
VSGSDGGVAELTLALSRDGGIPDSTSSAVTASFLLIFINIYNYQARLFVGVGCGNVFRNGKE